MLTSAINQSIAPLDTELESLYYFLIVGITHQTDFEYPLVNTHLVTLTRVVVLDYIWSAENGGDLGFAQCHLVWTGLPDLGLPGPKSSFSNFQEN